VLSLALTNSVSELHHLQPVVFAFLGFPIFGASSSTQLENVASLKKQFDNAKGEYEKIKVGNLKAFEKILEKNTAMQKPVIVGFEEFLKL